MRFRKLHSKIKLYLLLCFLSHVHSWRIIYQAIENVFYTQTRKVCRLIEKASAKVIARLLIYPQALLNLLLWDRMASEKWNSTNYYCHSNIIWYTCFAIHMKEKSKRYERKRFHCSPKFSGDTIKEWKLEVAHFLKRSKTSASKKIA